MAVKQILPDTIFDGNAHDLPLDAPFGAVGGRLMAAFPHTDGLLFIGAGDLMADSANLVLTRNGNGDWTLNRTAAGAETYNIRGLLNQASILRIGENYQLGGFGSGMTPAAPPKGVSVADFFAIYQAGVVALTTATLRLGKTVYSAAAGGAAATQTDLVAATAMATATTANYQYQDIAGPATQVFHTDDLGLVEIEARLVMANTGTIKFVGLGAHVYFNYN